MTIDRTTVHKRLNAIFQDVFDDENIQIIDATTSKDIEEWDSMMHITLVVAIEKEFGVTLNAANVGEMTDVGAMIDMLVGHATK